MQEAMCPRCKVMTEVRNGEFVAHPDHLAGTCQWSNKRVPWTAIRNSEYSTPKLRVQIKVRKK